jgi:hypothetical protein
MKNKDFKQNFGSSHLHQEQDTFLRKISDTIRTHGDLFPHRHDIVHTDR